MSKPDAQRRGWNYSLRAARRVRLLTLGNEDMTVFRNDAVAKVSGAALYADDYRFDRMAHAAPVYADAVHAELRGIDTAAAAAAPGVLRVITAADVPGVCGFGQIEADYPIFVRDRVRSAGDVIALVVAESRAQAIAAAALVRAELVALPAVLDPEEALRDEVLVHPARGTNLVNHHHLVRGDVERGLAESAHVIVQEFATQAIEHAYLEPESAVANPRPDGVLEIYGSMQHPYSTRRFCAALLGLPLSEIEVYTIAVGGGFGGKDDTAAAVSARAALAATLCRRPVKLTYDREWSMRESYKRHPYRLRYELGVDADGKLRAARIRIVADGGAYCSVTPWVTWRSVVHCCGPYDVPNVRCDVYGVYTNNIFSGAMRGFGSPQVNFATEQLIEMAAQAVGLDELTVRQRNLLRQGSVTVTGQRLDDHVVSLEQVFDAACTRADYASKRAQSSFGRGDDAVWRGVGLAIGYRGMSLGAEGADFCAAMINGQPDGSILVETGIHENGQGSESAMILAAAEALGVRKERIRYRRGSTSVIPDSGTTAATRGTLMGTSAVVRAADELKRKMSRLLATELGCAPELVRFADDSLWGGDGKQLGWEAAAKLVFAKQDALFAYGSFAAPPVSWDEAHGQGNAYFTYTYGCQVAEVEVERASGKVRVLSLVAAHDVGKAYNLPLVEGQVFGGITQAIGYALKEEFVQTEGRVVSLNFNHYKLPNAGELPDFEAIVVQNPDPNSASRAKGIGEPAIELGAAAIANAVAAATGRRFTRLPLRLGSIIDSMKQRGE